MAFKRPKEYNTDPFIANAFIIPHYKIAGYKFFCMASAVEGWEHVSISLRKDVIIGRKAKREEHVERTPTWAEMCFIKDQFWDVEDAVMQIHPPRSEWVSQHPYCLHLWRPIDKEFPRPDSIHVGVKGLDIQSF